MTFTIDPSLKSFFSPRGIALIGATQNPNKLGYGLARNLVQSNFPGEIYFINPAGGTLLGKQMFNNILEVPDPVDMAILLIPAQGVPQVLRDCGRRGINAAVIQSGGFRETGLAGATLEEECLSIAQRYKIRLLGPNCIGLLNTHLPLDATFLPPPGPLPGNIAFISHSGAVCGTVIDWARGQGFGVSHLVSLGNQADVNETDVLAPVAADVHTRVITMYLEGIKDGRLFVEQAGLVAQEKPIIALKVGRFASGQRAVASHTGALAGRDSAFTAAFHRAGVIRAETTEEMFEWARALAWCPLPKGKDIAVLTNAGGPGVTAADALEVNCMRLATMNEQTQAALRDVLPPAASLHNPIDMLATATPEQYAAALKPILGDPGVDGALVILAPPPMFSAGAVAKALIPIIHNSTKPVVVAMMGDRLIQEAIEHFRAAHIPDYRFPERAASALAILAQRAEFLERNQEQLAQFTDTNPQVVHEILEEYAKKSPASESPGILPQEVAARILEAYGIATLPIELATSADHAAEIAERMGYPVALKVASQDIPHKSDIGGVLLNLEDRQAVLQGFSNITESAQRARPDAEILGVHVQHMIPHGQEVIVGSVFDEQFGPLVMFGSGGVEVEGLKDVSFALAPMRRQDADYLLETTWAGKKLPGYRNLPPGDREAVVETLLRLAQLAVDFPRLAEIEINPLRVLCEGQGAFAIDMRLTLRV
jgi:acetyl coenzyme A synthetase (ADP forming)-like protein